MSNEYNLLEKIQVCPRCKRLIDGHPALSRRDNKTKICANCDINEAMFDFRMSLWKDNEQRRILIEKERKWLKNE